MSNGKLVVKCAHVFLGGPHHGRVSYVRTGAPHETMPRGRSKPTFAYDDVRTYLQTVLYVRVSTTQGDVFVCSECGPQTRARLVEGYENDPKF